MNFEKEYESVLVDVERQFRGFDLVVRDGGHTGNSSYISKHRHEYLRTLQDVDAFFGKSRDKSIFEIGAFFGVVAIALARLGYRVTASDVPEYMGLSAQQQRFSQHNVAIHQMNLRDYVISLPSESMDCVIMCEVLEHLNFNPLPLFKEVNRVLRNDGLLYIALPNGAQIRNRINMALGRPIGLKIDEFFDQLDANHELVANGHWREYTMAEIRSILEPLGFRKHKSYYFSLGECERKRSLRKLMGRWFYRQFPFFKENQTNLYVKERATPIVFDIPGTVHPTLRKL
ncbi:MAG: class I SAM-dependent methyltransferase [Phycisphaerae bacterium]|nr:class I SAM-dependent methyltransferase [Phycisphaerae bacterium]